MAYQKTLITHIKDSDLTGDGDKLVTANTGDSLTTNVPLLYDADGNVISTATRTGNTTKFVTHDAGGFTSGNLPVYDANGNLTDSGSPPGGGGGGSSSFLDYFPISEPTLSDWTLVDGSGGNATTNNTYGGAVVSAPNTGSSHWSFLKKSAPSPPFYVEFGLFLDGHAGGGIILRQASSGKFAAFRQEIKSANATLRTDKWNSETSFNGVYHGNEAVGIFGVALYLRWVDDNTNRIAYFSANGRHWTKFHSVGRTDLAIMDECGFGLVPQTTNLGSGGFSTHHVTCFHYDEGTP